MTIDPKTLPEGTVAEWPATDHRGTRVGYILPGGLWSSLQHSESAVPPESYSIARVFVPVPDGMTVEDAQQALTDHVAWVPVPADKWDTQHVPLGSRVRLEDRDDTVVFGEAKRFSRDWLDIGRDHTFAPKNIVKVSIHPDDAPDPDDDLIEEMGKAAVARRTGSREWWDLDEDDREEFRRDARTALAVVREHKAGKR